MTSPHPLPTDSQIRTYESPVQRDDGLARAFAKLTTSTIADAMGRLGAMDAGISPLTSGQRAVGPALPVLTRGGDNAAVHQALKAPRSEGGILVINGQGDISRGLFGELLALEAVQRGLVGAIVDGAVRDIERIRAIGFPVFGRAVTPAGPFKNGPGIIGRPVACGGVVCAPDDLAISDDDGVVVVPREDAWDVLERAREIDLGEARRRESSHE